ncbi:UNVERIFIED_CONTAM: hypothetical protein GTU68_054734, partial [Idotea baltica]|nr:hypothetical protein [Idotea baltica]
VSHTRVIKKYANRRLYDTVDSKHVTLSDIKDLIVGGNDVQIIDDTNGADITRPLLLQIITDQEQLGRPLLNEALLAQLIRFYGNPMQHVMGDYLQKSVDTFVGQQRTIQSQMQELINTAPMDLMQQNMRMWEGVLKGATSDDKKDAD